MVRAASSERSSAVYRIYDEAHMRGPRAAQRTRARARRAQMEGRITIYAAGR